MKNILEMVGFYYEKENNTIVIIFNVRGGWLVSCNVYRYPCYCAVQLIVRLWE